MVSKPSRHCTVELQALPSRISQVRRIVTAQLRYWRLDALIDRVALGVTELLTNVHRHAGTDKTCTVQIELDLDRLTVSVHDRDPRLPYVHEPEPGATGGRGLALIAALSESWGVQPHGRSGKTVWFALPTPPLVPLFTADAVYGSATTGPLAEPVVLESVATGDSAHTPARSAVLG
ncbi:ATP-binding protein [Streptomyces sp. NA04227]|uniref:ATP-binding protein n=1 Tax=Streptomyces sp. NA04227 TaxID=2742136 RepID=UPI001590AFEC|nr:ATP-binding protein [Streptomyces sp. NA04227]QKW05196.1 ATP-binding protein [Streptomyces sp. NA04227]